MLYLNGFQLGPGFNWNTVRRLISKSAFVQFFAILPFLHIWKNESQGYLKMQGPWQFLQNKGSNYPLKSGTEAKNAVAI